MYVQYISNTSTRLLGRNLVPYHRFLFGTARNWLEHLCPMVVQPSSLRIARGKCVRDKRTDGIYCTSQQEEATTIMDQVLSGDRNILVHFDGNHAWEEIYSTGAA
jgi:hypothetical protein